MNNVKPEFISAAKNGDIPFLRSYIASTIRNDPSLRTCREHMRYLNENGIDITEEYQLNITEEDIPTDESLWDERLFLKEVEYLRKNFAYEKRMKTIYKISRVIYAKEIEEIKENFDVAPRGCGSEAKKTSPVLLIAVGVIIVLMILFLLGLKK